MKEEQAEQAEVRKQEDKIVGLVFNYRKGRLES